MPRIPLPRRGLRSLITFGLALLLPYLILRHVYSIERPLQHSAAAAYNFLRPRAGDVGTDDADAARQRRARGKAGAQLDTDAVGADPAGRWTGEESVGPEKSRGRAQLGSGSRLDRSKTRQQHQALAARHEYLPNGLLKVNPEGRHPIYDLLVRGREAWEDKLVKQSKTLREAVDEYRRRYGRAPPKGFDRW